MAALHPTESGALLQEGHPHTSPIASQENPQETSQTGSFSTASPSLSSSEKTAEGVLHDPSDVGLQAFLEAGDSSRPPDYVLSHRQFRRLVLHVEKMLKKMHTLETNVYRQPHCPLGGEMRTFYLAPQQLKVEAACLRAHGADSAIELLDRALDLLLTRPPDPVLDLALVALRDARFLCGQMHHVRP